MLTKLELIKNPDDSSQIIKELPGLFVNNDLIKIRATFSEKLKTPPKLLITHVGLGVGTQPAPYYATYDSESFSSSPNVVDYPITLQGGLSAVGPISFTFTEDGVDLANNPLSLEQGVLKEGDTIERALILDAIAPDLGGYESVIFDTTDD